MLVLILVGIIMMFWLWSTRNRNKNEPPVSSGSKILIGHALKYAGGSIKLWNTVKSLSKEARELGGVLKTTIGPRTLYVITDPEDFLTVANSCLHKNYLYDFTKNWYGDGLLTSKPSMWKLHRKLLNPAFSQQVLDSFMDIFNNQSRRLVESVKVELGKGPFDHWEYVKRNALETICLTALGVDFKEKNEANTEFILAMSNIMNTLINRFQKFWLHNNFLFNLSSLKRKQDDCIKILHNMSNTILRQRKEKMSENLSTIETEEDGTKGSKFKPFIDLLLELSRNTNIFTNHEVRNHVDTIIASGHDTSATVIMFCILFVGSYPRIQEKIYEELQQVFGDEDRDVTKQDLSQLVYLEAVIKESMRIYPIAPVIARYLDKDIKLRNYTLSRGNTVFLYIYGVNRHSMWGPDVEEFRPERWLDSSTLPDSTYTSASFSLGRRNCIAKTYAMMGLKVTLTHFYRNYIVHGDHTKLTLKLDVMLKPVSGHHITIERRK